MIKSFNWWIKESLQFMPNVSVIKKCAKSLMAISNERLSDLISDAMRDEYETANKNKELFQNQLSTLEETLLKIAALNWKTPDGYKEIQEINKIHTEWVKSNPGSSIEGSGTKCDKIIKSLRVAKTPVSSLEE
jgi:hypothetical protein